MRLSAAGSHLRLQRLATSALLLCGVMIFIRSTSAEGDGINLAITIRQGLEGQAVVVGMLILIGVYTLIVTEVVHRTLAAALGGLIAVGALQYYSGTSLSLAMVTTMIDWETIGLLLGMMVMVGVLSHTGVFEWAAVEAYKKSKGNVWSLVVILCLITAVLSAFLDNVTTMLLLTPVTIQLAKVLDLKPIPLLIAEVIFSNIGGAATMIGDPPNIIIGNQLSKTAIADAGYTDLASQGISFNDFIIELAPGILMTIIPVFMMIKWLYAEEFSGTRIRDIEELEARYGIKNPTMLKYAGGVLILVVIGFFTHPLTHIPVSWISLIGAVVMLTFTNRHNLEEPLGEVEWTTLIFFAGLFVLIHSLQYMGVIGWIGDRVIQGIEFFPDDELVRLVASMIIILWVSAIASSFLDNIPYTATMVPVILIISHDLSIELGPLIWALAFGACLGGNGTLIGASANVVTAGMSEEAGYPISFKEFFRAGFPVMLLTTTIVTFYMVLVYAVDPVFKWVLMGLTLLGAIWQYSRGKAKGKNWAESLVESSSFFEDLRAEEE
jgi:Na+/H+ antiporter NhaD/arsenite permease-like protein